MREINDIFYCGMDIGGANTKYVVLKQDFGGELSTVDSNSFFFPFWEKKTEFPVFIRKLVHSIEKKYKKTEFGITITAELSDAFETKIEGIEFIVKAISKATTRTPHIYATTGEFLTPASAISNWLKTAASNWHATATIVSHYFPDALLIDIGSTTTDLIRIYQGKPCPQGFTDTERLQTGELIFVGILRTNLATLSNELLIDGVTTQTSTEFFACTGDLMRALGRINPQEYSIPTPDGKSTSLRHCLGRIAKVVCGDINTLNEDQIIDLAKQLLLCIQQRIQWGLDCQSRRKIPWPPKTCVLAGMGWRILGIDIAKALDSQIAYLSDIIGEMEAEIAPAFSVALLLKGWLTSQSANENHKTRRKSS
ncbi:MAG: hydantoinase/oxoprolinase family protein [Candidatus Hodarchaeota archaeon]